MAHMTARERENASKRDRALARRSEMAENAAPGSPARRAVAPGNSIFFGGNESDQQRGRARGSADRGGGGVALNWNDDFDAHAAGPPPGTGKRHVTGGPSPAPFGAAAPPPRRAPAAAIGEYYDGDCGGQSAVTQYAPPGRSAERDVPRRYDGGAGAQYAPPGRAAERDVSRRYDGGAGAEYAPPGRAAERDAPRRYDGGAGAQYAPPGRAAERDVPRRYDGGGAKVPSVTNYAMVANQQRGGNSGGARSGGPSYGGANGNGSQNTGNQIGDRNSSRVLAPPGGFSSFSLG